jgi:hypothetical protein
MNSPQTEPSLLADISQRLDLIIGLLVVHAMENADVSKKVERLQELKLSPRIIARATGISENAANIRLSRLRRKSSAARNSATK